MVSLGKQWKQGTVVCWVGFLAMEINKMPSSPTVSTCNLTLKQLVCKERGKPLKQEKISPGWEDRIQTQQATNCLHELRTEPLTFESFRSTTRRQRQRHKFCIFNAQKQKLCTPFACFLYFCTFLFCSRKICHVKWPLLKFYWEREQIAGNWIFFPSFKFWIQFLGSPTSFQKLNKLT